MTINGRLSKYLYESVIDFDLSSLYPSIILAFNIAPETCYGKLTIENEIGNEENFLNDYMSKDYINFGCKWFDLPNIEEMLDVVDSYDDNGLAA